LGVVGIDTLRVRGSVSRFNLGAFDTVKYRNTPEGSRLSGATVLLPSGIYLVLDYRGKNNVRATFEFSVPNVLFGNNVVLATPEQARDLVARLAGEAQQYLDWAQATGSFLISRIDITKDCYFEHQAELDAFVESQFLLKLPYNPDIRLVTDTDGSTYLKRGSWNSSGERWASVLYGKTAQVRALASATGLTTAEQARLLDLAEGAEHVVRNETRLRRPVLRGSALDMVGDISKDTVEELHLHYFHRAGFDREVGGAHKLRLAYERFSDDDREYFSKVIGMLTMERLGLPPTEVRNTLSNYQRIARKYGLSAADVTLREGTLVLHYNAARLVAINPDQRVAGNGTSTAPLVGPAPASGLSERDVTLTGLDLILAATTPEVEPPPLDDEWRAWWNVDAWVQDGDAWMSAVT